MYAMRRDNALCVRRKAKTRHISSAGLARVSPGEMQTIVVVRTYVCVQSSREEFHRARHTQLSLVNVYVSLARKKAICAVRMARARVPIFAARLSA